MLFVLSLPYFFVLNLWIGCHVVAFHVLFSLPIILTTLLYIMLVYTLKKKVANTKITNSITNNCSNTTDHRKKSMAKVIQGVVICLIVCNLPMMAWVQWWGAMLQKGTKEASEEVFGTEFGVRIIVTMLF